MNVNTVNFGDIIKEISHGLMAESYISDNEFTKPCEYLRLVDIDDGVIAENCIEIVYDSKRFEKYAIKDGDVILSTTDKNFKVVCAGDMGDRKLLVSPTLIRIGRLTLTILRLIFHRQRERLCLTAVAAER